MQGGERGIERGGEGGEGVLGYENWVVRIVILLCGWVCGWVVGFRKALNGADGGEALSKECKKVVIFIGEVLR